MIQKHLKSWSGLSGILALMIIACACSSTRQTENLLSSAGFKSMPASTPEQKAHLRTIPTGQITTVQRNGTTYYVYPDTSKQVLYVGQQPQYQEYRKLQLQNQMEMEQIHAAELNASPAWNVWGGWPGAVTF